MKASQLWFIEPGKVEIREHELSSLTQDEVLIKTKVSAISAGTEMLIYRGQIPQSLPLDTSIKAFEGLDGMYPMPYGYACVGIIEEAGSSVDKNLKGKKVFAFQPHASHFICEIDQLIMLPDEMSEEAGTFLANMETAVNFLIDGEAQKHESVAILGMGVVGQLVNALLDKQPLRKLVAVDGIWFRREIAAKRKNTLVLLPDSKELLEINGGFNLIFELSGNPEALNLAIELCAFSGRIIVGSWYGDKSVPINLGGAFHRNRLKIISSQVSTISPEHAAKWTKDKRLQKALNSIAELKVEEFITHHFPLSDADKAYSLIDKETGKSLQVILTYED